MHVTEKLTRPLTEAKYLNADNVDRYRSIMRIFYENYEKLKYWMYQEDVYSQMIQDPYFSEYRMEQCQQDLAALVEWKNLTTIQDTRKVSSIEEFKNKKIAELVPEQYRDKIAGRITGTTEDAITECINNEIAYIREMGGLDNTPGGVGGHGGSSDDVKAQIAKLFGHKE